MNKVYILAEVGSTHDGSLGNALEFVKLWADCGADAVKFQDHRGELVNGDMHPNPRVRELRKAYYDRTSFCSYDWNSIAEACKRHGVDLVVSVFSEQAAQEQASRVTAFKVASGQVTNLKLLRRLSELGKPVYLSSGMSTDEEYEQSVRALGSVLHCWMQCTSAYPCPPELVGLNQLAGASLRVPGVEPVLFGLSDHTMGFAASLAAITLGASVIERHCCFSRHQYGSDAAHSLEPHEFRQFVKEVRDLEVMLSHPVDKDALAASEDMKRMREVFLCKA